MVGKSAVQIEDQRVGTVSEQQTNDFGEVADSGDVQSGLTVVPLRVDIGAGANEALAYDGIANRGG